MSGPVYFSGRVSAVVFRKDEDAFYIMRMLLDEGSADAIVVKGNVPGIQVQCGTWFGFEAKWAHHEKYGKQLSITRAPVLKDGWDAQTAHRMLVANGVGEAILVSIRDHFGDDALVGVLEDAERLQQAPGITLFLAQHVVSRWHVVRTYFQVLGYLSDLKLPAGRVRDIWEHFGDDAESVLSTNPWRLVEVNGIEFRHADEVAQRLGLVDPEARLVGAVLFACKSGRGFGHSYLRTGGILQIIESMGLDVDKAALAKALSDLHKRGLLIIDRDTFPGTTAIYEPLSHRMEVSSSELLVQRVREATFIYGDDRTSGYLKKLGSVGPLTEAAVNAGEDLGAVVQVAIEEWGSQAQLVLSEHQKEGIFNALTAPVSILAGYPGTGKTTSLKAAVRILQDAGVPFLLCAPTGIAAKNLSARTGAIASTIHRAFSAKGIEESNLARTYAGVQDDASSNVLGGGGTEVGWGYNQDNPYPADVIIIDEASMIDQHLVFRLLDCTKPDARIVFVGDNAQLPSVGPGNVLRDIIHSELFPTTRLTQIFRQEDTSGIVYAAHSIVNGDFPSLDRDFRLIQLSSETEVLEAIIKIAEKFHAAQIDFQVLSPRHRGVVGVTNLNERLREKLNPASLGRSELKLGKDVVRVGDRVMIIKNDYKLRIYNGDIGEVQRVDRVSKELVVQIHGDLPLKVQIPFQRLPQLLVLAYASTIHKSQGLEYDRIVMPIVRSFQHQLQRNLLYTAITRAKQQVVLVGHSDALAAAVHNDKEDARATLFMHRLQGLDSAAPV